MAVKIGGEFKLKGNKIVKDERASELKLDLCTRLKRKNSKRIRVAKRTQS